jgi:hypothetical protein
MEALECTCPPRDWKGEYWRRTPCDGCEQWWELHSALHDELRLSPWHWPVYEDPAAANPYPEGSVAAKQWAPNKDAIAMYQQLKAAARAARRRSGERSPVQPAREREVP